MCEVENLFDMIDKLILLWGTDTPPLSVIESLNKVIDYTVKEYDLVFDKRYIDNPTEEEKKYNQTILLELKTSLIQIRGKNYE